MKLSKQIESAMRKYRLSKSWRRIVMALVCVVVFCTVYALILPAITLETDPPENFHYSSDLSEFTQSYELLDSHGNPVTNDTLYVGEHYCIRVHFKETNIQGDNNQFAADANGQLTYQFDNTNLSFTPTDWCDLMVHNDVTGQDIVAGRFKIDANGKLIVEYYQKDNTDHATPGTRFFDHYTNTELKIEFDVLVDSSDDGDKLSLNLGNTVHIDVEAPTTGTLDVNKTCSTYSEMSHSVDYTVRVECGHGSIHDLNITDVVKLRDTKTNIEYGVGDGKFSLRNMVIKDTFGNEVLDEYGMPIRDISQLPDTLSGGEGYVITYTVVLDPSFYDSGTTYSAYEYNTVTATAKDPDENPLSGTDTKGATFDRTNLTKTGTPTGTVTIGDTEYSLIRWTVYVGDYYNTLSDFTLTDVLGQTDQHYYTGIAPIWRVTYPEPAAGTLEYGESARISHTTATQTAPSTEMLTMTVPGGGSRCEVIYYTYTDASGVFTNSVTFPNAPGNNVWSNTSNATVVAEVPIVEKEIAGSDDENVYYEVQITVPGSQYGNDVRFQDNLTGRGPNRSNVSYINEPQDVVLTLTNRRTGETKTLTQYSGTGSTTDTYKVWIHDQGAYFNSSQANQFRITFPHNGYKDGPYPHSIHSFWPYQDDMTLTLTYRMPKTTPTYTSPGNQLIPHETMNEMLGNSFFVRNVMTVIYGSNSVAGEVSYNELNPIGKKGEVTDAKNRIISYRVGFTNEKFIPGGSSYDSDKVSMMPADYTVASFDDILDERTEYVDGTLYALIYQHTSLPDNIVSSDFGEHILPFGVFKYTGSGAGNDEIHADFQDFTVFDFSGQYTLSRPTWFTYRPATDDVRYVNGIVIDPLNNLDQVMKSADGGLYSIVFVYDARVKTEYLTDLSKTEAVLQLENTADVEWDLPTGSVTVGPVTSIVDYNTELLKKEFTHIGTDDRIHYVITANENGYDLTENEHYTLSDTMCEDLVLLLPTVTVEEGAIDPVTGDTVWSPLAGDPQLSFDQNTHTLRVVVPDDRPIKLSYDCRITKEGDVSLYNTVEITGYTKAVNTNNAILNVSGSGGSSGGGSEGYLYVRKNDADTHTALTDTTFALYGANSERFGDATGTGAPETVTVNGDTLHFYGLFVTANNATNPALNGTFTLDDLNILEENGHFAVKEIIPPDGYRINDTIFEFYWENAPPGSNTEVPVYVDGDMLVIDDELNPPIILPETGGIGNKWYIPGSLVIFITACVYGYILLRKRREGG